jgi:hypothetical protein
VLSGMMRRRFGGKGDGCHFAPDVATIMPPECCLDIDSGRDNVFWDELSQVKFRPQVATIPQRCRFSTNFEVTWIDLRLRRRSALPLDHQLLDLADRLSRIKAFRAGLGAIHDGVAAIELERVLQRIQALACRLVPAIGDPAIGGE